MRERDGLSSLLMAGVLVYATVPEHDRKLVKLWWIRKRISLCQSMALAFGVEALSLEAKYGESCGA